MLFSLFVVQFTSSNLSYTNEPDAMKLNRIDPWMVLIWNFIKREITPRNVVAKATEKKYLVKNLF